MTDPISVKTTNDISRITGKLSEQVKPVNAEDKTKAKTSAVAAKATEPTPVQTAGSLTVRATLLSSDTMIAKYKSLPCGTTHQIAASADAAGADIHYTQTKKSDDKPRNPADNAKAIKEFKKILEKKENPKLSKIIDNIQKLKLDDLTCLDIYKDKITAYISSDIPSINRMSTNEFKALLKLIRDVNIDDQILLTKIFKICGDFDYLTGYCSFFDIFEIFHILDSIKSDTVTLEPDEYLEAMRIKTWHGLLNNEDVLYISKTLELIKKYPKKHKSDKHILIFKNILNKINKIIITKETYGTLCDLMDHYRFERTRLDPIHDLFLKSYQDTRSFADFKRTFGNVLYLKDLISCLDYFIKVDKKADPGKSILLEETFIQEISNYILEAIATPNYLNQEQAVVIFNFLKIQKINDENLLKKAYELSSGENFLASCDLYQLFSIADSFVIMAGLDGIELVFIAHDLFNRFKGNEITSDNHTFIPAIIQKIATFYAVKFNALQTRNSTLPDTSDPLALFKSSIEMESPIKKCIEDLLIKYNEYLTINKINPNTLDIKHKKQLAQTQAYFRTLPLQFKFRDLVDADTTTSQIQERVLQVIQRIMSKDQVVGEFAFDEHFAYHSPDIYSMGQNLVVEFDGPHHFEERRNAGEIVSTASTILRDQILKRGSIYIREHQKHLEKISKETNLDTDETETLKILTDTIRSEDDNPFKIVIISYKDVNGKSDPEIKAFMTEKLKEVGISVDL